MDKLRELLTGGPVVANVGVPLFADALRMQGKQPVSVDWTPPASGNPEMLSILAALRTEASRDDSRGTMAETIAGANAKALEAIASSHPVLIGVGKAIEDIPGMRPDLILHAGSGL